MGFLKKPNLRLEEEAVPMDLVSFDTSANAWLVWLYILLPNAESKQICMHQDAQIHCFVHRIQVSCLMDR